MSVGSFLTGFGQGGMMARDIQSRNALTTALAGPSATDGAAAQGGQQGGFLDRLRSGNGPLGQNGVLGGVLGRRSEGGDSPPPPPAGGGRSINVPASPNAPRRGHDTNDPRNVPGMEATGGTHWDWEPFLTGGAAARPDSMTGMDSNFTSNMQRMLASAPPEIQQAIRINSAYRSPELQAQLYQQALARYGSEREARRWVAPPNSSQHNHGTALDLQYGTDAAREWTHANAARFGMHFPLSNENWHIEPIGQGGGRHALGTDVAANGTPTTPAAPQDANTGARTPYWINRWSGNGRTS